MGFSKFVKLSVFAVTLAVCCTSTATSAFGREAFSIAKTETKEKSKSVKKGASGKKSSVKPKTKGKSLKAKALPPKPVKITKKNVAKVHTKRPSTPVDWGFWFLAITGCLVIAVISLTIWYEYRPTINASGTVYGPLEYLPAHQGGAFTAEFNGNSNKRPLRVNPGTTSPATVTREPLHADSRSTTRPSATAVTANDMNPVKRAQ